MGTPCFRDFLTFVECFFIVFVSSDALRMGLNIRYGRVHIDDKVIP